MTEKRIETIESKLSEIMTELIGNEKFGRIGIAGHIKDIQRVQKLHGEEIQKIKAKLFKEKVVVGALATATTGTAVWFGKGWLIKLGAFLSSLK